MSDQIQTTSPKTPTPRERRQRYRDEMKSAILETAQEIMRQEGVSALNLHELARRVGLRTSSLYVYLPSRTPSSSRS